jgi:transcriptional regulator with XRE-family HTH domain
MRTAMEEAGISMEKLAALTGFSIATISRMLNGKTEMTAERLVVLAVHIKLPAKERQRLVFIAKTVTDRGWIVAHRAEPDHREVTAQLARAAKSVVVHTHPAVATHLRGDLVVPARTFPGTFAVFTFADGGVVVHVENPGASVIFDDPGIVAEYQEILAAAQA